MPEQNVWTRGQRVVLTAIFYDENGNLADPTTATIRVTDPENSTTDYTGGSLTHPSLGVYKYNLDTAGLLDVKLGPWVYAGLGAGAVIAAGKRSFVLVSEKKP